MPAKNTLYTNFVLENMIEELVASRLDLQQFALVNNALQGVPGMQYRINRYTATDGTQKLGIGEGNTESIVATFNPESYDIALAQNRFEYYDEEAMTDPVAIETGVRQAAAGLFDTMNADIYGEWAKGDYAVTVSAAADVFGAFVDAQAMINKEELQPGEGTFAIVAPRDLAYIRKALGNSLQYVEAFARQGYVGTVGGTNLYVKKNATPGKVYVATREAVTIFVKTGTEVEIVDASRRGAEDANVRLNTQFARKYYVVALTDATKVVEITLPIEPEVIVSGGKNGLTIAAGATAQLKAEAYPASGVVSWSSGTTTKATVSDAGVVTGVTAGTSLVTASMAYGGSTYTDTILITVAAG